ncbi:MAG: TRAP transporter substrate-binding protein [Gammaproteobacteria bacterium]|nr:TRAP transporter substrate-binding protein [Gammaproteobacteria bacterium]
MKKLFLGLILYPFLSISVAAEQWRIAAGYADDTLQTKTLRYFAEQVKNNTKEQIDIEVFPNQSLYKQQAILQATKNGQVELGEIFLSGYDKIHAVWGIDNLPFIANSYEKAEKLWLLSKDEITSDLEKMNLVLLYAVPWPGQNIYSKDAIEDNSYFAGKNFRTYNAITAELASLLGADAKNVQYSDLAKEFSGGGLDIMMTSSTGGVNLKAWNYVKNYTKIDASFPKNIVFINKDIWESLDSNTQAAIKESAKQAEKHGWELSKSEQKNNELILSENGIEVSQPKKTLKQLLLRVGQKLDSEWRQKADDNSLKVMKEFRGY